MRSRALAPQLPRTGQPLGTSRKQLPRHASTRLPRYPLEAFMKWLLTISDLRLCISNAETRPKTYVLYAVCVAGLSRLIPRHLSESRVVYRQARGCLCFNNAVYQIARFQDLLQQPSYAYCTGRANAGYAQVAANRQSPFVSMATTLSGSL
jgi:hypothetical protein